MTVGSTVVQRWTVGSSAAPGDVGRGRHRDAPHSAGGDRVDEGPLLRQDRRGVEGGACAWPWMRWVSELDQGPFGVDSEGAKGSPKVVGSGGFRMLFAGKRTDWLHIAVQNMSILADWCQNKEMIAVEK